MGLGKTIQTIALLSYLADVCLGNGLLDCDALAASPEALLALEASVC